MKEKSIQEIRERHRKEIEDFQGKCNHKKLSGWIEEWWAPGHSTGKQVKICMICDKVIEREE